MSLYLSKFLHDVHHCLSMPVQLWIDANVKVCFLVACLSYPADFTNADILSSLDYRYLYNHCPGPEWNVMCRGCCEYDVIRCKCPIQGTPVGYAVPCCRNAINECDPCIIHPGRTPANIPICYNCMRSYELHKIEQYKKLAFSSYSPHLLIVIRPSISIFENLQWSLCKTKGCLSTAQLFTLKH